MQRRKYILMFTIMKLSYEGGYIVKHLIHWPLPGMAANLE